MNDTDLIRSTATTTFRRRLLSCTLLTLVVGLGGCDMLGIETPATVAAAAAADGKAAGAACRHAGRAIEDCYALNAKAHKAAVFEGWREMNDYMTKNKIEVVAPQTQGGGKQVQAAVDSPRAAVEPDTQVARAGSTPATSTDANKARPRITAISEADIMSAKARAHTP